MRLPSSARPWVAASLIDFSRLGEHGRRAVREGADLLEVRADLFPPEAFASGRLRDSLAVLRRGTRKPLLLTLRTRREGGGWRSSEKARRTAFVGLLPRVDGVDVEGASPIAGSVLRAARRAGKWTVLSHHDFKKTPSDAALGGIVRRFRRSGADVLKVAVFPSKRGDVERLRGFCAGLEGRRAFISMGPAGRGSRLEPGKWGSCLTYGFIGRSAAPGQVPVRRLAERLRRG